MGAQIEIHAASAEERAAADRNVYEVWGRGLPLEEFLERRATSVVHRRAEWFVLTIGGAVIASLARHPLRFHYRGQVVVGSGIGSVHTVPEHRRRGYAAALLREVNQRSAGEGHRISLLFSDIKPGYYERLGYVRWPSLVFRAEAESLASGEEELRLEPTQPQEQVELLAGLYDGWHGGYQLYVDREREYWEYSLMKNSPEEVFLAVEPGGRTAGYVRLKSKEGTLEVTELGLGPEDRGQEETLYRAVGELAHARGLGTAEGWLPNTTTARALFACEPRTVRITMLAALADEIEFETDMILTGSHFWVTDHF